MRGVFSQVAVCLLLVTASIFGATGTATANTGDFLSGKECEFRGLASLMGFDVSQCQTPDQYANATQADLYVDGLGIKDNLDQQGANYQNNMDASRKLTWCRAKADTIEGLQNDDPMSETLETKNETVDSYYAGIQWNFLQTTNTTYNQIRYMSNTSQQTGAKALYLAAVDGQGTPETETWYWDPLYEVSPAKETVELIQPVNGQQNVSVLNSGKVKYDGGTQYEDIWSGRSGPDSQYNTRISVQDPETDELVYIYNEQEWMSVYDEILTTHENMDSQTTEYTKQMYSDYEEGEFEDIDTQQLHSACSLSTQSTDQDTTGSYAELRSAIGLMGFDTDANTSFTVDYSPEDSNGTARLEGGLMTDWKPTATNGEYRTGETYDTAETNESVLFVAQFSNESSIVNTSDGATVEEMNGEFTIVSMRDASTGEEVNTTTTEDQNVQTANTSRTAQEVSRIIEYRNTTTNNYQASMPGGGGIPLPDASSPEMLIILGSLIAAAYLVTKEK